MADGRIGGTGNTSGSNNKPLQFGTEGDEYAANQGDGTGTGAIDKTPQGKTDQQAATEKLHADATPVDQKPGAAKPGAVPSDNAPVGKDTTPAASGKQASPEAKTPTPESKAIAASQTTTTAEKAQAPAGKSQPEHVAEGKATKELPAASLVEPKAQSQPKSDTTNIQPQSQAKPVEANKVPESLHLQEKDQAATSAKALAQSDRNTADSPQAKTNTSADKPNEPIGRTGNQKIESQPPPGQQTKPQEATYQTGKPTSPETRPEARSIPVPVPVEIHQPQKNQNPASAAHQPEAAPIAPQKDLTAKLADAKVQLSEPTKLPTTDGKAASEAVQGKKSESPSSPTSAGELGQKDFAGREGKLVPEPNTTKNDGGSGGTGKEFNVAQEASTKDAPIDKTEPRSQIKAIENEITPNKLDAIIEKNKDHNQIDSTILPTGRKVEAETPVRVTEGKQDTRQDKDGKEVGQKLEPRPPGAEGTLGGSIGAGLDARGGRTQEKVEPSADREQRGEIFKALDGKPLRLDFASKETCKQLLDLINQIDSNKFKPLDQAGRERLSLLLELNPVNRAALKEVLQSFVMKDKPIELESVRSLMAEKLDPMLARQLKDMADGRIDDAQKLQRLEARVKDAGNFLTSFASHVFEAFNRILTNARQSVSSSEATSVDDILQEAHSDKMSIISVVEQTASEQREQLLDRLATYTVAPEEIEPAVTAVDEAESVNRTKATQDKDGKFRKSHTVESGQTYKSIAIELYNGEARLEELLKQVNGGDIATFIDDRVQRKDLEAGDVIFLPTDKEVDAALEGLNQRVQQ